MLLQLTIENVLSFREPVTFSMLASPEVDHKPQQVINAPGCPPVLRVAAIYGANASGKSNLVAAVSWVRDLMLYGVRPGKQLDIPRFKLDNHSRDRSGRVELELFVQGFHYSYGVQFSDSEIIEEWLLRADSVGEKPVALFERKDDKINIRSTLSDLGGVQSFLEFVALGTRMNQPFITELREKDYKPLSGFFKWLGEEFEDVFPDDENNAELSNVLMKLLETKEVSRFTQQLLRETDTGVDGFQVVEVETPIFKRKTKELVLYHQGHPMSVEEESDGTVRLMSLGPELHILFDDDAQGPVLFVDELDRSLHTLLTQHIIKMVLAADPRKPRQLIFTTHDTNLLDLALLPRDSVWFVEKDKTGNSTLYSLAEFKSAQLNQLTNELEKGYLQGRFGAIPFPADPRRLGWLTGAEE